MTNPHRFSEKNEALSLLPHCDGEAAADSRLKSRRRGDVISVDRLTVRLSLRWTGPYLHRIQCHLPYGLLSEIGPSPNQPLPVLLNGQGPVPYNLITKTSRESRKAALRISHLLLKCQVVFTKICQYHYCPYCYCRYCHYY